MIRSTLLVLAAASALALAPGAHANEPVVLRDSVSVTGETVTLGDLFDIEGETAAVMVSRSPEPGQRGSIDPDYVRTVASRHGLAWANATGLRRITVTRASRTIDSQTLHDLIEGELYAREGRSYALQINGTALLHAPADSSGLPRLGNFQHDTRTGLFAAEVLTHDGAEPVRISGRAHATAEVPVLARPIPAGEVITEADIEWISTRADRIRADAVLNADAIAGQEARRALRPGEPLRAYDLRAPVVISRGEIVSLVFTAPGISLNARARALEDAGADEIIRFVNLQSNRTVEAMVEGPGRARVVASGGPS